MNRKLHGTFINTCTENHLQCSINLFQAASEFRKEWLNFDMSWLTASGDGIVKPAWNNGVSWTVEALADSPQTIQKWGSMGWQKVSELSAESPQTATVGESAPSMKQ